MSIDDEVGDDTRSESIAERWDRHWGELLQELRVVQTGVQIVFAFLLILPFQDRFADLDDFSRTVYVAIMVMLAMSMIMNLAPVIVHRYLYTRHKRDVLLSVSDPLAKISFITLGLGLLGAIQLAVDMVLGRTQALILIGVLSAIIIALWIALPLRIIQRSRGRSDY
ncbi:MAG: DUF6328 family protein [Actinomycetia bacterium]|nr:DUF6328 family protein [Actinomycetes bacterium]